MGDLLLPVGVRRMSSYDNHRLNRTPRSSEPGTDFYCPIGTPIVAPADGTIWGSGESLTPATGKWVGINFDNGMSWRTMHHSRNVITSGRVKRGQIYALSGATGYGEADWSWNPVTGGAHVHATLWPTHEHRYGYRPDGRPYTVDLMNYVGGSTAGGNATPFDPEEDDMGTLDKSEENYQVILWALQRAFRWDLRPGGPGADAALGATVWERFDRVENAVARSTDKVPAAVWNHPVQAQNADGILASRPDGTPVTFPASGFAASSNAQINALREVVATLALGQGADPAAIEAAAERGAQKALDGLVLRAE